MKYKFLEHTADVMFQAFGKSLNEVFENSAVAMFEVMVDIKKVALVKAVKIKCSAENDEELLIEWLNNLLAEAGTHEMVFSKFKVKITDGKLAGKAFGEKLNEKKHDIKTEVKAATYSGLFIKKQGRKFIGQVVVDV